MHQQLWGYKVEEKLYLGVREQKGSNTTGLKNQSQSQTVTESIQDMSKVASQFKAVHKIMVNNGTGTDINVTYKN
jgi:hypothetical protein